MGYVQLATNIVLFTLLYLPLFPELVTEWMTVEDYSHGFFIPILSIYFLWRNRESLKNTRISPSASGVLFILSGVILYISARMGYQFFLQCFSMLIVLFGLVYAQAGREMAKKTAFSISYLVFMIPLPQLVYTTITFHLRLFSTRLAFFFIKLFGISAMREGNIINLPSCKLVVATPCSGLRSLIVFMAISLALGYIFQKNIKNRVLLFISSIILAVLMNTVRLVSTAYIAYMRNLQEILPSIHDTTGIVVLIIGFLILFTINDLLSRKT